VKHEAERKQSFTPVPCSHNSSSPQTEATFAPEVSADFQGTISQVKISCTIVLCELRILGRGQHNSHPEEYYRLECDVVHSIDVSEERTGTISREGNEAKR
jgi:hypothetical protein